MKPNKTPPDLLALLDQPTGRRLSKRERTRRDLVLAAMRVVGARSVERTTVQQIAVAAGVTTVTFYNYFESKAEIVSAIAMFIAEAMRERSAPSRRALGSGAERMAAGCLRYLRLARSHPAFASLVLDVAATQPQLLDRIGSFVGAELRLGVRQKDFHVGKEAALDVVIGSIMRAMHRIAEGRCRRGYERVVTAAVLQGLGLSPAKAHRIVHRPLDELIGGVP